MKRLLSITAALLLAALSSHALAQGITVDGLQPAISPQCADEFWAWQAAQNPNTRKYTLSQILGGLTLSENFATWSYVNCVLTKTYNSETQNTFFASPSGSAGLPTFRAIVGADLPNPSASTLGGVESYASVSHQWINQISTSGVPSSSQPACGDLSNSGNGCSGTLPVGANPTATAGPAAVNGVATTFMRSDGAPPVQLGTNAQKGIVQVDGSTITASSGVITTASTTVNGTSCTPGSSCSPSSETKQVVVGGNANQNLSNAATEFIFIGQGGAGGNANVPWPISGTFKNFGVSLSGAPGGGTGFTFTLDIASSPTSLACTISNTNTTCTDNAHTATVTTNQLVVVTSVPIGTPASNVAMTFSMEFDNP